MATTPDTSNAKLYFIHPPFWNNTQGIVSRNFHLFISFYNFSKQTKRKAVYSQSWCLFPENGGGGGGGGGKGKLFPFLVFCPS